MKDNHMAICKSKVKSLREADIKHSRPFKKEEFITIDWIQKELNKLNNECIYCSCVLLLNGFDPYNPKQFSVDRIDNALPHHKSNCVVCCLNCNLKNSKTHPEKKWLNIQMMLIKKKMVLLEQLKKQYNL